MQQQSKERKQTDQIPEQPTSKLTSLGPASAAKLKVESVPALMCVYLSVKEWVCVSPHSMCERAVVQAFWK